MTRLRWSGVAAAAAMAMSIALGVLAPSAGADADGCTSAPPGWGSVNCVEVHGIGQYVSSMRSAYNAGAQAWANVCNPTSNFKYKKAGTTSYVVVTRSANNCGYWRAWLDHAPQSYMVNNSTACTRQKNTWTGGAWSPYACVSVYS